MTKPNYLSTVDALIDARNDIDSAMRALNADLIADINEVYSNTIRKVLHKKNQAYGGLTGGWIALNLFRESFNPNVSAVLLDRTYYNTMLARYKSPVKTHIVGAMPAFLPIDAVLFRTDAHAGHHRLPVPIAFIRTGNLDKVGYAHYLRMEMQRVWKDEIIPAWHKIVVEERRKCKVDVDKDRSSLERAESQLDYLSGLNVFNFAGTKKRKGSERNDV